MVQHPITRYGLRTTRHGQRKRKWPSDYAKFNGVNFPQWKHFIDAVDQLKQLELWINEELLTIMLLSSLPLEYESESK
jgi:hypothetical protein